LELTRGGLPMSVGILSPDEIRDELLPDGGRHGLHRPSGADVNDIIGFSSVDLPLGTEYWVMLGSCRSGKDLSVADLLRLYAPNGPRTLTENTVLEKGHVYLVKVDLELALTDKRIRGKSTGRSSIGRLDVLVRLLIDGSSEFDQVPECAKGALYVEVAPITFNVLVSPGTCLSQLRLFRGDEDLFTLTMDELGYEAPFPVVNGDGARVSPANGGGRHTTFPFSLELTPDAETGIRGFVARDDPPEPIDPELRDHYDPHQFWEAVESGDPSVLLETDRLYILRSKERLKLPGHLAVECQAYTETLGEWRIEYAGFAHPWFGSTRGQGTPIIFEVRGHNIPTILRDGLQLGKVSFRRMSKSVPEPDHLPAKEQYEQQELKLSSCFKAWDT